MLGIIVIILTAILSFNDKPELFAPPRNWGKICTILVILCVAGFGSYKEFKNSNDQDKANQTIAKLEGIDTAQSHQIDSLRYENKVAQDEHRMQTFKDYITITDALARYGLRFNKLDSSVSKVSGNKEVLPTLVILNAPTISINKAGETETMYEFQSLNAESYIIEAYNVAFKLNDFKYPLYTPDTPNKFDAEWINESTVVPINETFINHFTNKYFTPYSHYVLVIELLYKSKSGKIQPPLIKTYIYDGVKFFEASKQEYSYVYSILEKYNLIIEKNNSK